MFNKYPKVNKNSFALLKNKYFLIKNEKICDNNIS